MSLLNTITRKFAIMDLELRELNPYLAKSYNEICVRLLEGNPTEEDIIITKIFCKVWFVFEIDNLEETLKQQAEELNKYNKDFDRYLSSLETAERGHP